MSTQEPGLAPIRLAGADGADGTERWRRWRRGAERGADHGAGADQAPINLCGRGREGNPTPLPCGQGLEIRIGWGFIDWIIYKILYKIASFTQ